MKNEDDWWNNIPEEAKVSIGRGLKDSKEGRVHSNDKARHI